MNVDNITIAYVPLVRLAALHSRGHLTASRGLESLPPQLQNTFL